MLFSVIVPVYNVEKYLAQCVESVLNQQFTDYELLLVDDGSTDHSGEMCDAYEKKYPEKVRVYHKQNEGLLRTRRYGFREAKGDYFICLDSDDWLATNALERIDAVLKKDAYDLVIFNHRFVYSDGSEKGMKPPFEDGTVFGGTDKQILYREILTCFDINRICDKAISRKLVDINNTYQDYAFLTMGEDILQMLPIFTRAEKIAYISDELNMYRKAEGSITNTVKPSWYESFLAVYEQIIRYANEWKMPDEACIPIHRRYFKRIYNLLKMMAKNSSEEAFETIHNKAISDGQFEQMYQGMLPGNVSYKERVWHFVVTRKKISRVLLRLI